ncbi:MAG: WD40 repeat domain-containing protein, partial [Planctomycetota bacterium]
SVGAASFYAWRYGGVELNGDEQQSDPTPTPPLATIEVPVVVDPPQARVAINGVVLAIENGRGAYQAMPDELLKIEADYGSDWRPFEKIYSTADLEGTVNIALQRTAESWESLAYERLGDNQFAEAVDALANAIKGDKSFAAVPKPDYEKRLPGEIQSLRANRDGSEIVAGTSEGVVQRWKLDGDDVKLAARIELADADIESLVVSDSWMTVIGGDRRRVLLSSADETVEWGISNMPEGTQVKEIAIVDGGKRLVAATELFEFLPGESDKRNVTLISWALHRPTATDAYATHLSLDGDSEPVLAAARRGAWVVLSTYSTSDKAYHVRKHLLENGGAQELHRQRAEIVAIAVSLDDQLIAIGGGKTTDNEGVADCRATLIHAGDLSSAELDIGHEDVISSIAIDAAGRHVVTAGMDGAAIVWSLRSGWRPGQVGQPLTRSLLQLPDQPFVESAVCLHSGWTACLYANGAAALWDSSAKTPTPLRLTAVQPQFLSAIATTPGGEWLITGDRSGRVRFWRTDRLRLIKNARDQAGVGEERSRTDDHVMRCGRFGRPTRRSPEAYAVTACDSGRRPTEATV